MPKLLLYTSAKAFQARKKKQALVPTTFVDSIRPKTYVKKNQKKRCSLTLCETLDKEKTDKQQNCKASSVEQTQIYKYLALIQTFKTLTNKFGLFLQNSNLGFGQQFENVLDSDDLYNFPDYDIDNIPTQPENEDNDDDL